MMPPICKICDEDFNPEDGGLIHFIETKKDKEYNKRLAEPGFTGHPSNAVWFCSAHYKIAESFSNLNRFEAMTLISQEAKIIQTDNQKSSLPLISGKAVLDLADKTASKTLEGIRWLLANSLDWSADQLKNLSDVPIVKQSELAETLRDSSSRLYEASKDSSHTLLEALNATSGAFDASRKFLELAGEKTRKSIFENIVLSSIVGESFAGVVKTSEIRASFRHKKLLEDIVGEDITPAQAAENFYSSGLKHAVFCIPGLLCDEGLWSGHLLIKGMPAKKHSIDENTKAADTLEKVFIDNKVYPLYFRFNPGVHISENGLAMLNLLEEFFAHLEVQKKMKSEFKFDMISYSQGGLILRSTLYQAKKGNYNLASRLRKVLLISSPDGGSYLEKMGFWFGLGLENAPLPIVKTIGFIANQRSDAIKDLSHGIIRREDWQDSDDSVKNHKERYSKEQYFGELDDVDAFQLYSLIYDKQDKIKSWLGDGIVEEPALALLSDRVYRKKENSDKRVRCLLGLNHFQIIQSPETLKIVKDLLRSRG